MKIYVDSLLIRVCFVDMYFQTLFVTLSTIQGKELTFTSGKIIRRLSKQIITEWQTKYL